MSSPASDAQPVADDFLAAGRSLAALVRRLPDELSGPGIGTWDLRTLVGHSSRSLITVVEYLDQPRPAVEVASASAYYVAVADIDHDAAAVDERAVRAGIALGTVPADTFDRWVQRASEGLAGADPDAVIATIFGGMRVRDYLPTRTFELVVHGLDIARAVGLDWTPPDGALSAAAALATEIGLLRGQGADVLHALTGRGDGISVLG